MALYWWRGGWRGKRPNEGRYACKASYPRQRSSPCGCAGGGSGPCPIEANKRERERRRDRVSRGHLRARLAELDEQRAQVREERGHVREAITYHRARLRDSSRLHTRAGARMGGGLANLRHEGAGGATEEEWQRILRERGALSRHDRELTRELRRLSEERRAAQGKAPTAFRARRRPRRAGTAPGIEIER